MALKHVIIGGGTGYIGSALAFALRAEGATVSIISRKAKGPNQVSWEDVKKNGLPKDTTAVINVAGQNILDPTKRWGKDFKTEVWDSRVNTTRALAEAVKNSGAEVFATVSGVAYYKPNDKEWTEDDKCEKYDYLSELCHEWEAAADLPADSKCRRVTVRSGVVLGRTGGMIKQAFIPFFLGLGGPIGVGTQPMPWIHIADLVNLFKFSVKETKVRGILNGVAPEIITNKEFTAEFAKALKRPAIIPLPEFVINLIFGGERAKIVLEGQKVKPKRVLDYGFQYKYPTITEACKQFSVLSPKTAY
ncbi:epimerase family protein SDR39U1 isoform X2 [Diachasmimorpha longicaudata]|uniref:epimerase family protein SDR39U1 isoform X2 n=1 Tax=Diachasmimorpha longicaudata TaxID=58733 RepID=UPI0030B8956F